MKEKFYAKSIKIAEETEKIIEVANKIGIILPSTHTALFQAIYSPIEEANLNGIRLSKHAVEKALPGLIASQSNLEHLGQGFMIGVILDAWINSSNEIEIIFSFAKNLYADEFERAKDLMQSGKLSVSFELLAETDAQEHLDDGTIKLHDIDFQGVGLLLDNPPAYPGAKVYEYAKQIKERLSHIEDKELICASVIKTCDKILSEEHPNEPTSIEDILWTTITTRVERHIHVVKIDIDGNGESKGTFGDDEEPHTHKVVNYQIQAKQGHAHRLIEELLAKRKEDINKEQNQGGVKSMTDEQKKLIEKLRAELGDFAKDVKDEDLLDATVIAELRKAQKEAKDAKAEKEKSDSEKAEDRIKELEARVEELEKSLEAKDSEIEAVRENAEKIGKTKVQLKDNDFAKDFTDEDYLDDEKVEKAIQDQKNSKTVEERKEELKDNDYAKDFKDEDYLNDDKVELAKVKQEKDELAKKKDKKTAKKDNENAENMNIGDANGEDKEKSYQEVMASIRKDKNESRDRQTIYERK